MLEKSSSTVRSKGTPGIDSYLTGLGNARTARHASEEFYDAPEPGSVIQAVQVIRQDIAPAFVVGIQETTHDPRPDLADLKRDYWSQASRVGIEHGAKPGFDLEMYLTIGEGRSYASIKENIEREYTDKGSVPRSVLDGIDAYTEVLQINPAHATAIVMELIGRNLGVIKRRADELQRAEGIEPTRASAGAFASFITEEIPLHLNDIIGKYGVGDKAIRPVFNKGSFYPDLDSEPANDETLILSEKDAAGLVEAYDIQSRPYDDEALAMGNELAHLPETQIAMFRIQEGLVEQSRAYLDAHPERAAGNLENFNEIFVPERSGGELELLPNPKLIRAMVNNVMPGIATSIMRRGGSLDTLKIEDINEGVRIAAKEFKLFQSRIGQFDNYNPTDASVELHATFQVVCPANSLFPNYLTANLAKFYEEASAITA